MTIFGWPVDARLLGGATLLSCVIAIGLALKTGKAGLGAVEYDRAHNPTAYGFMIALIVAFGACGAATLFLGQG